MNNKIKKLLLLFFANSFFVSILLAKANLASTVPKVTKNVVAVDKSQTANLEKHFQQLGVAGSIVIYDAQNNRNYQHNQQRNQQAFLPASTFKILNSLICLETGVIDDEIAILTWDGVTRSIPEWNRDLNMREAFKLSAVWFYQVLARKVGYEKMQAWVSRSSYGNEDIGNKEDIDAFWLTGDLRITPEEQIEFLRRFHNNDLPFSERSLSIVKDIMIVEQTPEYTIRAKTGVADPIEETQLQIGWYVGYIEKGENVYFFATNIDIRNEKDIPARIDLTRRCLKELNIL